MCQERGGEGRLINGGHDAEGNSFEPQTAQVAELGVLEEINCT